MKKKNEKEKNIEATNAVNLLEEAKLKIVEDAANKHGYYFVPNNTGSYDMIDKKTKKVLIKKLTLKNAYKNLVNNKFGQIRNNLEIRKEICSSLKEIRIKKGFTQIQLSEKTDISVKGIIEIEKAQRNFGVDYLEKYLNGLGLSLKLLNNM